MVLEPQAKQSCCALICHLSERVDVVRAAAAQSAVNLEILSRLYNREAHVAGARSRVGAAVESATLAGETRKLITKSAAVRATESQGAAHLTPTAKPASLSHRQSTSTGRRSLFRGPKVINNNLRHI